ncbi:MAG: hypothetical protein WBC04_16320 [Candidatus Acidiferrales bacterium]
MAVSDRITTEKTSTGFRFEIHHEDDVSSYINLTDVPLKTADLSPFGMSSVPSELKVYNIATNRSDYSGQAAWDGKSFLICAGANPAKHYAGSLKDCILRAYNDGLLS